MQHALRSEYEDVLAGMLATVCSRNRPCSFRPSVREKWLGKSRWHQSGHCGGRQLFDGKFTEIIGPVAAFAGGRGEGCYTFMCISDQLKAATLLEVRENLFYFLAQQLSSEGFDDVAVATSKPWRDLGRAWP